MSANTLQHQPDGLHDAMIAEGSQALPGALPGNQAPAYDVAETQTQRDELPSYEEAPSYDRETHDTPLHRYFLRAIDKKNLMAVPYGPSASSSFKITSRSSRPFSKKPDMEVWRSNRGSVPTEDEYIAGIWFDKDGPIPWCPRAHFTRRDPTDGDQTYKMEARNFSDWTVSAGDTLYQWMLEAKPFSLVLRQSGTQTQETVARFNFSVRGLAATRGEEVGDLSIYRDGLSRERAGVEVILCGLITSLFQFKKMGREYRNEPGGITERAASLPEERIPLHRIAVANPLGSTTLGT